MSEEAKKELQVTAGGTNQEETEQPNNGPAAGENPEVPTPPEPEITAPKKASKKGEAPREDVPDEAPPKKASKKAAPPEAGEAGEEAPIKKTKKTPKAAGAAAEPDGEKAQAQAAEDSHHDMEGEIDDSNAEDAEDTDNERRHHIPFLDYHALTLENLVGELQRLLRNEKVQAIRRHTEAIKHEFDQKFQEFIDHKKEEFVDRGGQETDFRYNSVTKRQFNELYAEYREKRNQYYKNLEQNLKQNLANRLEIIEELKGLVNIEEDMTSTYKSFKELQERWRHAGPIPRANYNDVWRTYQHHVEIFYDFLHLNRELRDLDFKHNLEEKEKLVVRAEALAAEPDLNKAFRELQTLHKIWKEEVGPVAKEHRDAVWERFSAATKAMHQRRQDHLQELEKRYEVNLVEKQKIIGQIQEIATHVAGNHRNIQQQIQEVEALREKFFQAGKVPQKDNEPTWAAFKAAVRSFNRTKNTFYKDLKKDQQHNLDQKRALLERARQLQDSEDWETATAELKRIQQEWKQIGHVPRKFSDKIWKQFKEACNHYFDRLHARRKQAHGQESENLDQINALLDQLKAFELSGKKEKDLQQVQAFLAAWKGVGRLPNHKKHLNSKFHKVIDALLRKMGLSRQEAEIVKYGNKIQQLAGEEDGHAIEHERQFIRKKIEEYRTEIRQLENNLAFFSDPSEKNPLVQEVVANIARRKETLAEWKGKLKKLNILRNNLQREEEADASEEE